MVVSPQFGPCRDVLVYHRVVRSARHFSPNHKYVYVRQPSATVVLQTMKNAAFLFLFFVKDED